MITSAVLISWLSYELAEHVSRSASRSPIQYCLYLPQSIVPLILIHKDKSADLSTLKFSRYIHNIIVLDHASNNNGSSKNDHNNYYAMVGKFKACTYRSF